MAELSTLARPYAKAAFEYAVAHDALDAWSGMLAVAAAVTQQEKVAELLASPDRTSADLAASFCQVVGDALDQQGQNFIATLAENKRIALLPQISEEFEALKSQQEHKVDVEVTSAFTLDPAQQQALAAKLKETLKRDIELHTQVDESLLGGVLIRADDLVIDGSVRGRLAKLAEAMNQ